MLSRCAGEEGPPIKTIRNDNTVAAGQLRTQSAIVNSEPSVDNLQRKGRRGELWVKPVSYTHLDVYKRQR